jgi:hypothetical protein
VARSLELLVDEIEVVIAESEEIVVHTHGSLLEFEAPRVETIVGDGGRAAVVTGSWRTTGALLESPSPPGLLRQAMLMLRPWRLAPPPAQETERPLWHTVAFLYAGIAVLIALEIVLAFVVAYLVTGRAV